MFTNAPEILERRYDVSEYWFPNGKKGDVQGEMEESKLIGDSGE